MKSYRSAQSWTQSWLLFHAMPRIGVEGVMLAWANEALCCLGVHQEIERSLDPGACAAEGIVLLRRECGGPLLPMDEGTLLYTITVERSRITQSDRKTILAELLRPLLQTCRALGLEVEHSTFGHFATKGLSLFRGTLMESYGFFSAAGYLQLRPLSKRLQATLHTKALSLTLSEIGIRAEREALARHIQAEAALQFGAMPLAEIEPALRQEAEAIAIRMLSPAWVLDGGRSTRRKSPLAHTGILPTGGRHSTEGGTIYASVQYDEDARRILSVVLSGDFFVFPPDGLSWLENALENCPRDEAEAAIRRVYRFMPLETPGISAEDWLIALNLPDF